MTSSIINHVDDTDFAIFRGAAMPITITNELDDVPQAFAATLAFRVKVREVDAFTLTIGSGIALQSYLTVADAMAIITLTEAQQNQIPVGRFASYILTESVAGNLQVVMAGRLVGQG